MRYVSRKKLAPQKGVSLYIETQQKGRSAVLTYMQT